MIPPSLTCYSPAAVKNIHFTAPVYSGPMVRNHSFTSSTSISTDIRSTKYTGHEKLEPHPEVAALFPDQVEPFPTTAESSYSDDPPESAKHFDHAPIHPHANFTELDLKSGSDSIHEKGYEHPISTPDDPWNACYSFVRKYDKELCDAWRDEMDKLLIFAGLFSATVTAFTIESYKLLQPDPNNSINQLLNQFSTFARNSTAATAALEDFAPTASAIRINMLWFLSLTLSLTTVLVGILCLQWLREYQREANLPYREAFAVRQMRHEGLVKWRVPLILSGLPVLLQSAVILFFLGVVDFIWSLNRTVAIGVTSAVGFSLVFLAVTSILPVLQSVFNTVGANTAGTSGPSRCFHTPQCPYKSPLSWVFYQVILGITFGSAYSLRLAMELLSREKPRWSMSSTCSILRRLLRMSNWTQCDMYWRQVRNASWIAADGVPCYVSDKYDNPKGLAWLGHTLASDISAIQAIYGCIKSLSVYNSFAAVQNLYHGQRLPQQLYPQDNEDKEQWTKDLHSAYVLDYFAKQNNHARDMFLDHRVELLIRIIDNARDPWRGRVVSLLTLQPEKNKGLHASLALPFEDFFQLELLSDRSQRQLLTCLRSYATTIPNAGANFWEILESVAYYLVSSPARTRHRSGALYLELSMLNEALESWVTAAPPSIKVDRLARCLHYVSRFRLFDKQNEKFPIHAVRPAFSVTFDSLLRCLDDLIDEIGMPPSSLNSWTLERWSNFLSAFLLE